MKVSWIDADAFRSLADSLLDDEQRQSSQEAATRAAAHLQAQALAARLQAMSMMDAAPPEDLQALSEEEGEVELGEYTQHLDHWEEESPEPPVQEDIEEIRKHLEDIRDRARQSGLFKAFQEEAPDESMDEANLPIESPDPAPSTPEAAAPATPEVQAPATPEVQAPATPEVQAPATPEAAAPATPEVQAPATPEAAAPATPEVQVPATPEVQAPATPEAQVPATPEAPEPEIAPSLSSSLDAVHPEHRISLQALRERLNPSPHVSELPEANEIPPFQPITEASLQLPEFPQDLSQSEPPFDLPKPSPAPAAIPPLAFDSVLTTGTLEDPSKTETFLPISGTLQERLGHFATWASHLTGAHDVVVVDQHGDLLWGEGRCSDLVASALLAVHTQWRNSPANLAQRHPHLDSPLSDKKVLSLLPCSTRFGQVTLGLVLGHPLEAERAHELGEGLLATVHQDA